MLRRSSRRNVRANRGLPPRELQAPCPGPPPRVRRSIECSAGCDTTEGRKGPKAVKRSLGLFDVTCLGVNAIVGSGIFALPDDLHREMGGYSPLAFLLCSL